MYVHVLKEEEEVYALLASKGCGHTTYTDKKEKKLKVELCGNSGEKIRMSKRKAPI